MIYTYIVGPLFTEADAKQRMYEGKQIETFLKKSGKPYTVINPIDLPVNDGNSDSISIFEADYVHQCKANAVFLELANQDTGSHTALGVLLEKRKQGKQIKLYPVYSDCRLKRNGQSGLESTIGFNSYVIGALKANHIMIYDSFEDAFMQFCKDVENNQIQ